MKKISLILALSLGLSACAEKDSDYARKYRDLEAEKVAKTDVAPIGRSFELCEEPTQAICDLPASAMVTNLKKEGFQRALSALKKKHALAEGFDGSDEAFEEFGETRQKYELKRELLQLADQEYRTIYNYDEDLNEAGAIVVKLMINIIKQENLDEDGQKHLIGTLNTSVIQTITDTFATDYQGKDLAMSRVLGSCGVDGLNVMADSFLPHGGPNGIITVCPGQLLLGAGKDKQVRIAGLVMVLAHELARQWQLRGWQPEEKTLACINAEVAQTKSALFLENRKNETLADVFSFKVLNAFLKTEQDKKVKLEKVKAALNWICHLPQERIDAEEGTRLDNESRILNYFKLKDAEEILSCSGGPRC